MFKINIIYIKVTQKTGNLLIIDLIFVLNEYLS